MICRRFSGAQSSHAEAPRAGPQPRALERPHVLPSLDAVRFEHTSLAGRRAPKATRRSTVRRLILTAPPAGMRDDDLDAKQTLRHAEVAHLLESEW